MFLFAHFSLIHFQIFILFTMLGRTKQAYRYFLLMLVKKKLLGVGVQTSNSYLHK